MHVKTFLKLTEISNGSQSLATFSPLVDVKATKKSDIITVTLTEDLTLTSEKGIAIYGNAPFNLQTNGTLFLVDRIFFIYSQITCTITPYTGDSVNIQYVLF